MLLLAALVGAACGSDREGDDDVASPSASEAEAPAEDEGGLTFGDFELPCGGDGEGNVAGEQGVTEDTITIGYGDDAGYSASPGLNHQMSDAVKALIDMCNEAGGINGRTIEGKYYDAKITEVNNAMQRACSEVFMLVGQGWALDSAQEETRVGCELASVPAYSVSPAFANGPWMIQGVPNPVDYTPGHIADAIAKMYPDEVKKVGTLVANYAATLDTREKIKSAFPTFGWNFDPACEVEYNIGGESDWKPFAQRLKDCGAELVYYAGSAFPNFQNFLEAANQLDYEPVYVGDANLYEEQFAEWSTNGFANKVHLRFAFVPLEERDDVKAVDDYLSMLEATGGDPSLLGMQATSSTLLWMQGVAACGAEVTRQCVIDEIGKITDWTAGGLHAPTNPATNLPPACGMVLKLTDGKFERVVPEGAGEFECDEKYVTEVSGTVVEAVKLNDDRISTLFYAG